MMVDKRLLLSLLMFLFTNSVVSKTQSDSIVVSGNISGDPGEYRIRFHSWNIKTRDLGTFDQSSVVKVTAGKFSMKLPATDEVQYVVITEEISATTLLHKQYLESGDSIHLSITFKDSIPTARISGANPNKYNFFNKLDEVKISIADMESSPDGRLRQLDSLRDVKVLMVKEMKPYLSEAVSQVAIADVYGDCYFKALQYCFDVYASFDEDYSKINISVKSLFDKFVSRTVPSDLSGFEKSDDFLNFHYFLSYSRLHRLQNISEIQFSEIFNFIFKKYTGEMRERLLVRLFEKTSFFSYLSSGVDARAYKDMAQKTLDVCTLPAVKQYMLSVIEHKTIGSKPYDFSLLADSSNMRIKLSQFKGKVILVDMYGYLCTGCYKFATFFHKYVYPELKADTNFVVVSVMLESEASRFGREEYMERIRGGGIYQYKYTFPDYVNLYAANGEPEADKINEYYKVSASPFILLIDKNGKLVSTTLPLFVDPRSSNISRLKNEILKLL